MIKYYFLLFIRNIRRQKLFSTINLLGLTAGFVSTLLIYLYVQNEFSFDRFHTNWKNIYRINQTFIWSEQDDHQFASLGPGVAYAISTDIPEVKSITRVHALGNFLVTNAENKNDIRSFDEGGILAVDSTFLEIFTFPLTKGNQSTALNKPGSVILTESIAKKYFGSDEPLGKLLRFGEGEQSWTYEVTGVTKDAPSNSYIEYDILLSMSSLRRVMDSNDQWIWTTFETFVLLDEYTTAEVLAEKLATLPKKYAGPTLERGFSTTYDEYIKSGKRWDLFVQPLSEIRLHSTNIYNRLNDVGNIKIVYVLITVEGFIILLSCINFMNLSTAQYTRRIKESGLRKILGSQKLQLAIHFFLEAFMFCCIAAVIGFGLTQLVLPFFNVVAGTRLEFNPFGDIGLLFVMISLILVMSFLSGSYPAIFLSKFSALEAIKGKFRTGKQGKFLRNGLVAFQFFISMVLIVCTVVVFQQINYLNQKDIGFNRENLMVLNRAEWVNDHDTFLNTLKNIKGVEETSWCTAVPPNLADGDGFKAQGAEKFTPLNYLKADEQYVTTLGLDIIFGRNFSKDIPGDKNRIIINEGAVHAFGWPMDETVIGKLIEYPGQATYEVVAVVRDFNYWPLQSPIQPMAIFHINSEMFSYGSQCVALRVTPGNTENLQSMISGIQQQWKQFAGDHPFLYDFVDDSFEKTIQSEKKFGQALIVFAGLAILIACFGLLGMIIYTLEQRTKEIAVRKVVGASIANIWLLFIKDYTYLITGAILCSVPICIWLLNNWLQDFTYRIEISPTSFLIAGGGIVGTSLIVTSYHVIKAALTNPVDILKDE